MYLLFRRFTGLHVIGWSLWSCAGNQIQRTRSDAAWLSLPNSFCSDYIRLDTAATSGWCPLNSIYWSSLSAWWRWSISSPPTGPVNRYHFTTSVHTLCHLSPHIPVLTISVGHNPMPFFKGTMWRWCEPRVSVEKYRQEVGAAGLALSAVGKRAGSSLNCTES